MAEEKSFFLITRKRKRLKNCGFRIFDCGEVITAQAQRPRRTWFNAADTRYEIRDTISYQLGMGTGTKEVL